MNPATAIVAKEAVAKAGKTFKKAEKETANFITNNPKVVMYGVATGLLLYAGYKGVSYIRSLFGKSEKEVKEDLVDTQEGLNEVVKDVKVRIAAKRLAEAIRAHKSQSNPYNWIEDEDQATEIVIAFRHQFEDLAKGYTIVTNGRLLVDDLLEYIDDDNLEKIRKYLEI